MGLALKPEHPHSETIELREVSRLGIALKPELFRQTPTRGVLPKENGMKQKREREA